MGRQVSLLHDSIAERLTSAIAIRKSMSLDHMHPPTMAGICGSKIDGARSVVLAGEYDDEDHGETLCDYLLIGG